MDNSDVRASVYGLDYDSALSQMQMIEQAIKDQIGKGFTTDEACAKWAKEHHIDLFAYSKSAKAYYHITHSGDLLIDKAWFEHYCDDVLFIVETDEKGRETRRMWKPTGIAYLDNALNIGEVQEGKHPPMYHRNYFVPKGFYDPSTKTFNSATPFPAFAKETGRDTSHIYTLINNIAGKCAPYLLGWLRAKMINPTSKTEIVPVFASRTQGNGKTTFAETICKGMFGADKVIVTDQFDANARFNAEFADALILEIEEKNEKDSKVDVSALKARSTASTVRKEYKGFDPIIQANHTEFIVTTNRDVPIRFDSPEDQRRFMIMDSNEDFRRDPREGQKRGEVNDLAKEVFNKLYGVNDLKERVDLPFTEDKDLISQFKHELYTDETLAQLDIRDFPKDTEAYKRCKSLPRTTESVEIDSIMRTLAPFIKASLQQKRIVAQVDLDDGTVLSLSSFISAPAALQYIPAVPEWPAYLAVCRPLIFYDQQSAKPYAHAIVERGILDCAPWLLSEYGIKILPNQLPLPGGFMNVMSRYRQAPAARFVLIEDLQPPPMTGGKPSLNAPTIIKQERIGERLRVNKYFKPDPEGEYETVNEMKPGTVDLTKKSENVQYMDTFLFEADDVDKKTYMLEKSRLIRPGAKQAEQVFFERLRLQRNEANRLLDSGVAFRIVYSGGKSYHILVRIKDAPITLDEYKWLHAHLCTVLSDKVDFDPACNDPARLTRSPIDLDRHFMYQGSNVHGKQGLYKERPHQVYDYNWRPIYSQWLNRPLDESNSLAGKRMVPCKQEYKDAMWALGNGTFWTDERWNGERQRCFFPGYRLLRIIGFSHEQLWSDNGILDGLCNYYRKNEIDYWRNRESSDIIKQIDRDVDAQLEAENAE